MANMDHITETAKEDSPAELETSRREKCPFCGSEIKYGFFGGWCPNRNCEAFFDSNGKPTIGPWQ